MRGRIDSIRQNVPRYNVPCLVLSVDGHAHNLWDKQWIGKLSQGDVIEYAWRATGKSRSLTIIEPVPSGTDPCDSDKREEPSA